MKDALVIVVVVVVVVVVVSQQCHNKIVLLNVKVLMTDDV